MIKFEVRIKGRWLLVEHAVILGDGKRLAYWYGAMKGIALLSDWRLAESTIQNLSFKAALWNGLSAEEKAQASVRQSAQLTASI